MILLLTVQNFLGKRHLHFCFRSLSLTERQASNSAGIGWTKCAVCACKFLLVFNKYVCYGCVCMLAFLYTSVQVHMSSIQPLCWLCPHSVDVNWEFSLMQKGMDHCLQNFSPLSSASSTRKQVKMRCHPTRLPKNTCGICTFQNMGGNTFCVRSYWVFTV